MNDVKKIFPNGHDENNFSAAVHFFIRVLPQCVPSVGCSKPCVLTRFFAHTPCRVCCFAYKRGIVHP